MLTCAQYVYIMIYVEASEERNRMKKVNDVNGNEIDFYAAAKFDGEKFAPYYGLAW